MPNFDERLDLGKKSQDDMIIDEHLIRYELAGQFVDNKIVLDAACGSGYGSAILAKNARSVLALDIDKQAIAEASEHYRQANLKFEVEDVEKLAGVADKSMEVVVSFETIEHLKNYQGFLKQIARVLTDGGLAIVSTPNIVRFGQTNLFHVKEFTREEFKAALLAEFKEVVILDQVNALASIISGGDNIKANIRTKTEPWYFIALASNKIITEKPETVISLNQQALDRREANPAWQLANKLYKILSKLKIIR